MSSIALEESSRLTSCHQMCTNENPRNLRALTSDATRGFKPKQEVVRAKWKLEPVTDVDGFAGLAKVWPEAVTMLGDDNLLTLVCQGPADLAKIVLSMIPATLPTAAHIRFAAAWRLYQLRRTNEDSVRSNGLTMALDGSSLFDVLGMFGWAAQHGQSMITVEKPADLQACTVADLVKATTSAIAVNQSQAWDAVVCAAWRGLFAPLLRECLPHLPADVWYILARSGQPEAEWPEVLRLLAAVLQGHASPDNINTLGDILGPQSCTLLEHYQGKTLALNIIQGCNGRLNELWQVALLMNAACVPSSTNAAVFVNGIRALRTKGAKAVKVPDISFKSSLQKHEARMYPDTKGTSIFI